MNRRIVCAALRNSEGMIITGARHFDGIMHSQIMARNDQDTWRLSEQGFIDQEGMFLSITEAWSVAYDAGQVLLMMMDN